MTEISYASIARKKKIKRGFMFATIIVAAAIAAVSTLRTENASNKSNTISISGPWEMTSLDPSKQGYILTRMQVIETLLNVNDEGVITAGLATHWKNSDDGLTWEFTLRKGVKFHDGTEMNAQNVVNSLSYAKSKHGTINKAEVTKITAVSSDEIKIELAKPYTAFTSLLTNYSNAILSPVSYETDGKVETPYGSGPYQLESFEPPHQLIVKKFDEYWGQKPKIDFAAYLTGHRAESRVLQAKSGEADIVFTLDPSMLSQLKDNDDLDIHSSLIPRTLYVKINAGHKFLNDVKARQALSMGLDRLGIAKSVLNTEGSETVQMIPSSMKQWFIEGVDKDEHDLEKAQSLLAELGWLRGESGLLERDGERFELTMITYADRPELSVVATAIQAQWAKLGVKLKVDVTNSSMIPAGHNDGTLEMALIARNFGFSVDPLPIINSDFTQGGADWGAMNWNNAQVDRAMEELIGSNDPARSFELSQQIAMEIYQGYPVLPISVYTQHTSVNHRVKNFKFDPFERDYFINQMEFK